MEKKSSELTERCHAMINEAKPENIIYLCILEYKENKLGSSNLANICPVFRFFVIQDRGLFPFISLSSASSLFSHQLSLPLSHIEVLSLTQIQVCLFLSLLFSFFLLLLLISNLLCLTWELSLFCLLLGV